MPRQHKRPEDLKTACIDEALSIIEEQGLDRLSLREVARRLGVSHAAPYKHFQSRDHILAEVVSRAYRNFAAHLKCRPAAKTPHEDLHNMGIAYIQYAFEHPLHYRLMFDTALPDPESHPGMLADAKYAFALLQKGVDAVHDATRGPGPHGETDYDALFIWSTLHGLVGAMQSDAMKTVDVSRQTLQRAVPEIMRRMGRGVFGEDAPPIPERQPKLPS